MKYPCNVNLNETCKLTHYQAVKDAAENDCWYVWGVNDVINNLRVEDGRGA